MGTFILICFTVSIVCWLLSKMGTPHSTGGDEIEELKRKTEEMARRQGMTITRWGEVKTDSKGQKYIECQYSVDDDKVEEAVEALHDEFGEKIVNTTVIKDRTAINIEHYHAAGSVNIENVENIEIKETDKET